MAAPREMFARFVESTQDWVQERQVGLRLKKFVRVVWVILCEWRPFWITLVGLGGAVGVGWGLQIMSCLIKSGLQGDFWSF